MKPTTKWLIYSVTISIGAFVGWHFGIGIWATGWTVQNFYLAIGQGVIVAGIMVILQEIEENWYGES